MWGSGCRDSGRNCTASAGTLWLGDITTVRKAVGILPSHAAYCGERFACGLLTIETAVLVFTALPFTQPHLWHRACVMIATTVLKDWVGPWLALGGRVGVGKVYHREWWWVNEEKSAATCIIEHRFALQSGEGRLGATNKMHSGSMMVVRGMCLIINISALGIQHGHVLSEFQWTSLLMNNFCWMSYVLVNEFCRSIGDITFLDSVGIKIYGLKMPCSQKVKCDYQSWWKAQKVFWKRQRPLKVKSEDKDHSKSNISKPRLCYMYVPGTAP